MSIFHNTELVNTEKRKENNYGTSKLGDLRRGGSTGKV